MTVPNSSILGFPSTHPQSDCAAHSTLSTCSGIYATCSVVPRLAGVGAESDMLREEKWGIGKVAHRSDLAPRQALRHSSNPTGPNEFDTPGLHVLKRSVANKSKPKIISNFPEIGG